MAAMPAVQEWLQPQCVQQIRFFHEISANDCHAMADAATECLWLVPFPSVVMVFLSLQARCRIGSCSRVCWLLPQLVHAARVWMDALRYCAHDVKLASWKRIEWWGMFSGVVHVCGGYVLDVWLQQHGHPTPTQITVGFQADFHYESIVVSPLALQRNIHKDFIGHPIWFHYVGC